MSGSQKGSVMVIVIVGITILAAIGGGVVSMVNTSARTGVDHSLSVQALYAAESGLEWAGLKLWGFSDWNSRCTNLASHDELPVNIGGQAKFTIVNSMLYYADEDEEDPAGCKITVAGWVGSDENNPLAKRMIKGRLPQSFITSSGGGGNIPDGVDVYGGDGEEIDGLSIGTHKTIYVKEGTIVNGEVSISNHSDVYFYNNVTVLGGITLAPQGFAYFGDNFNIVGNIIVSGDACFGNDVVINGDLTLSTANADVCIKDNVKITGTITLNNQSQLCIGLNSDIGCGGIIKHNNSQICTEDVSCDYKCNAGYLSVCTSVCGGLCEEPPELTGDGVSQNPVGSEDGNWSEG